MTDTEDPNIATLREALAALYSEMNEVADYEENEWRGNLRKANAAADALASTLAELTKANKEVVATLHEEERATSDLIAEGDAMRERIRALEAPPAPAPGEVARAIAWMQRKLSGQLGHVDRVHYGRIVRAAESWQRIQWRPASEAACSDTEWVLLSVAEGPTRGLHAADGRWFDAYGEEYAAEQIFGFIPLDALPALNGGDDEEAPFVCPGCHAVAPERCLPGCIDDAIERDRQDALMRGNYDDRDEDGGDDNG